jgi:hypothetical protein
VRQTRWAGIAGLEKRLRHLSAILNLSRLHGAYAEHAKTRRLTGPLEGELEAGHSSFQND